MRDELRMRAALRDAAVLPAWLKVSLAPMPPATPTIAKAGDAASFTRRPFVDDASWARQRYLGSRNSNEL